MALPDRGGRSRSTIVLLVLTAVTLLTLDGRDFGPLQTLQDGLRDVVAPVRDAADAVVSPVGNVWNGVTDYDDIKDENEELRAELERLQAEAIGSEADAQELERLRALHDIDYVGEADMLIAEVVGGPIGNFEQFYIEIDRGSSDGLIEDMAVVTAGGLVGRLTEVDSGRSRVMLVTDPTFSVGVSFGGGRVLAHGTGEAGVLRVDTALESAPDARVGEAVTTHSSVFPRGIPVGTLSAIDEDDEGNVESVTIELSADVRRLELVSVVLVDPRVVADQSTDVLQGATDDDEAEELVPTTTSAEGVTATTDGGEVGP